MATRKSVPKKPAQHYAKGAHVRLSDAHHRQLKKLKEQTRVPIAAYVQMLVEADLAKRGLWPPADE